MPAPEQGKEKANVKVPVNIKFFVSGTLTNSVKLFSGYGAFSFFRYHFNHNNGKFTMSLPNQPRRRRQISRRT